MRSSSPEEEAIIDYTLSLAAVKSGWNLDTMPSISMGAVSEEHSEGFEVASRHDVELEPDDFIGKSSCEEREDCDVEEDEIERLEVDERATVAPSIYTTEVQSHASGRDSVSSKLKSAKKKFGRFFKKTRNKLKDHETSKPRAMPSLTSFSGGFPSSGIATVDEETSGEEGFIDRELILQEKPTERKEVTTQETTIANQSVEKEELQEDEGPVLPSPPPEASLPDLARQVNATSMKNTTQKPVKDIKSKEKHEVPQNTTSETEDEDVSSYEDERKDDKQFSISKVSSRTFIITKSASLADDSLSEERPKKSYGFFSCDVCGSKVDEFDDDFDDAIVQSDSEEGHVADAVLTIQEHAIKEDEEGPVLPSPSPETSLPDLARQVNTTSTKNTTQKPVKDIKSKEKHEVPQNTTSETEDEDVSSYEDERKDDKQFSISKLSPRTFVISESASLAGVSWSEERQEERPKKSYGFFSCGVCGGNIDEFDDDFDDETVQSDSEEGRVIDAVLTIQEHAAKLGLTEYELLEMIQDQH